MLTNIVDFLAIAVGGVVFTVLLGIVLNLIVQPLRILIRLVKHRKKKVPLYLSARRLNRIHKWI